jgi:hypothetical protein
MKYKFLFLLFAVILSVKVADSQQNQLLSTLCTSAFLGEKVLPLQQFHPFPTETDRNSWARLASDSLKMKYIAEGEKLFHQQWKVLPVSQFLGYVRTGNRDDYQSVVFDRRRDLASLVMAEVLEGKGRFTDDIINGVWAICEETFWGIPAHLDYRDRTKGFPDPDGKVVDLFAAETGSLLAWTYYLLGNELDSVSPFVRQRMYNEVNKRIFEPCMATDMWWMGFNRNTTINWNPWINSNWLTCILLMESDSAKRVSLLSRNLKSLDNFIDHYPVDGGCDEGPSYWTRAGAALYQSLGMLYKASDGAINIYSDKRVAEIARYIYRLHINNHYFVNFADASAIVSPDPGLLYNIGKQTNDDKMLGFASFLGQIDNYGSKVVKTEFGSLFDVLSSFEAVNNLKDIRAQAPLLADSWLPGIEVCTARSHEGSAKGFFFAALGGHNAENHNHNDVGSFVLYYNGQPFLIDAGVGDYTAKTFGSNRYDIWTMQSVFHNLPTINGIMQKDGAQYKALNVRHKADKRKMTFSLDIAKAYPEQALVNSWVRTYTFNRTTDLIISDKYDLKQLTQPFSLSFMSFPEPVLKRAGVIEFQVDSRKFTLHYPSDIFEAVVEKKEFTDLRLKNAWGRDYLYRIVLKSLSSSTKGGYFIQVAPNEGGL